MLLLAGLGIYGVVSDAVAQRTAEIGIRMALGARTRAIQWLVVRQGLGPLLIGLAVGIAGLLGAERLVGSMLFGVRAGDFPTTAGGGGPADSRHAGRELCARTPSHAHRPGPGAAIRMSCPS